MSSSNRVRIAFIAESTYGVTPGSGNFSSARFTSENLSGTPDTVESQQIRTDRLSSGQVVVGLAVAGDLQIELAKELQLDALIESAMFSTWDSVSAVTVDLEVDATAKTIERSTGNWNTGTPVVVGDFLTLAGFVNTANNVQVMVAEIVSTSVIRYAGPTLVDEVGSGTSFDRADKIAIGTTKKSFSMEKAFLDLTTKAINYRGMIANTFALNFAHGELATGSIGFSGNDYETADSAGEFITNARTIDAAATSQTLNGSIDMPFFASSESGDLDLTGLDLQSLSISLNNNLTPQNVIGNIAPRNYSEGTAQISIELAAYLTNAAWAILPYKLVQTPIAIGFQVKNTDGWYGFYLPAVQLTFEDPASGGQNQDILLNATGVAKVGALGEKSMTIYRGT